MKSLMKTLFVLTTAVAAWSAASAQAADMQAAATSSHRTTLVDQTKRYAAFRLAGMLEDRHFVAMLDRHLSKDGDSIALNSLLADYSVTGATAKASATMLRAADQRLREHKGIAADAKNLLQVRLYVPKNRTARIDWKNLLVAYPPSGKSKKWSTVEAFDRSGMSYTLDARTPPSVPVLIAGLDERTDLSAGIAVMNRALQEAGLQSITPQSMLQTMSSNIETTKLDQVRLNNDQEPWISGAAEVYAVVSGIQPDQAKATLTVIDMPYLDYDGTTYSPNQIMIFWSEYRYAAANIQFFEHDDNTNYKDLAVALSQGVTTILGAFAPSYAVIGQVATAILQAMPDSWYTNDDDYVDSFYTLEKGRVYSNYNGAAGNATISLSPYTLIAQ